VPDYPAIFCNIRNLANKNPAIYEFVNTGQRPSWDTAPHSHLFCISHLYWTAPLILITRGRKPITRPIHSTAIKWLADESRPSDQNPPSRPHTSNTYTRAASLYSSMYVFRPSQAVGWSRSLPLCCYIVGH